jgi:hypothetical protein
VKGETSRGRAVAVRASLTEANNTKLDVPDRLSSVFIRSLIRQVERRGLKFGTTAPSYIRRWKDAASPANARRTAVRKHHNP